MAAMARRATGLAMACGNNRGAAMLAAPLAMVRGNRGAAMLAALLAIGCAVADDVPVVVLRTPAAAAKMAAPSFEELWNDAGDHMPWVVETRRELHRMPELLFDEHMTSGKIASVLASLGVNFTTGWAVNTKREELAAKGFVSGAGGTGIVAEIGSGGEPCVLLRSDIDALPIHETAPVPWRSEIDGRMHACGHDGHAAMLLGAAAVLKRREADIIGTVRLVFQPAEEGGAGGKRMVEDCAEIKSSTRLQCARNWTDCAGFFGCASGTR